MKPATATTGFFQEKPTLHNQYTTDHSLVRALDFFLPDQLHQQIRPGLTRLGQLVVSPQIFDWVSDAETNLPAIQQQDTWGNPLNKLVTSEGWKRLKAVGVEQGLISTFYAGTETSSSTARYARVVGFAKNYLFSPSSAFVTCPFAMTDGVARACQLFGPFEASGTDYYARLVSPDPQTAWTSGQWMTERPGGSDVSNTETVAVPDPAAGAKQYRLSGFKWFSSATDSQVTITLARIGNDKRLTCFIVPVTENVRQGNIRIHRLKKKFGTSALPTAELELRDVNGEMVGERGRGVATIATVLNITRVYSSVGSASYLRRALAIAREYSLVRSVFGRHLCDLDSHVKVLAEQETLAHGLLFLSLYAAELLGVQEAGAENVHQKTLNRIVPGIAKAYVCKKAVPAISECIEALGGVGYLEFDVQFNVARLLRDAQVNPIWEGTTNVLSDDFVRFLMNNTQAVVDALEWMVQDKEQDKEEEDGHEDHPGSGASSSSSSLLHPSQTSSHGVRSNKPLTKRQTIAILKQKNAEDLQSWVRMVAGAGNLDVSAGLLSQHAREYLMALAEVLISTLLVADASRTSKASRADRADRADDIVALEVATRWTLRDLSRSLFARHAGVGGVPVGQLYSLDDRTINRLIVYRTTNPRTGLVARI